MKLHNYNSFITESLQNKHSYYLPTYEECREMCDNNDNLIFYESKHVLDGYDISIFNYRLASYNHFNKPIPNNDKVKAFEMRGITFVWNKDGSLYNRFLLLDKFFNLNQTPCSMYDVVKDLTIKHINNKEDGSIASFVKLPNGKMYGRSKTSFQSDQAFEIQRIYDTNKDIKTLVDFCLNNDIIPIFEYVSPTNRIVLRYQEDELILLKLRNNKTGEYLDIDIVKDYIGNTKFASYNNDKTLDDLISLKDVIKDKEGDVVQFTNGKMIKIKSKWYSDLHKIYTEDLNRENCLIELILDEKIDDIIVQIEDKNKIKDIENLSLLLNKVILFYSENIDDLLSKYKGDRKTFVLNNRNNEFFSFAMKMIDGGDKIEMIKSFIKKSTSHLKQAQAWIKKWENIL